MNFRNDEYVPGIDRPNVHDGKYVVRLVNDADWQGARNESTKNAGVGIFSHVAFAGEVSVSTVAVEKLVRRFYSRMFQDASVIEECIDPTYVDHNN
jgi:hypothetical protein